MLGGGGGLLPPCAASSLPLRLPRALLKDLSSISGIKGIHGKEKATSEDPGIGPPGYIHLLYIFEVVGLQACTVQPPSPASQATAASGAHQNKARSAECP